MYLHLGQDYVIGYRDIVGIFDIETVSVGKATRAFFRESERRGQVVTVSEELWKIAGTVQNQRIPRLRMVTMPVG